MREAKAQTVLLVRAFEESDPQGALLTAQDRRAATDAARGAGEDAAAERAERLAETLEAKIPGVRALLRGSRLGAGATPWVLAGAFAVGLLGNVLGPARRIDVWQWPFVALFAWNALWYVVFLVGPLLARRSDAATKSDGRTLSGAAGRAAGRGARLAGRLVELSTARFASRARARDAKTAGIAATAVGRYTTEWRRATAPLLASRARLLLHAGSLALATGLVVGMYARALTFRYEAAWESTVLDAPALQRMTNGLLGPAAAVLSTRVPDVRPYEDPARGPAAPWLHLYAVATALYVAVPRALFLLREAARAATLSARVPAELPLGYARRAGLAPSGEGTSIRWRGLGYAAPPRVADAFTAALHAAFGSKATVTRDPDVGYGDDDPDTAPPPAGTRRALLVSLGQTPEAEVHGTLLAARVARGDLPLLVADASPLVARGGDTARIAERRRLWTQVAAEAGTDVVHVELGASLDDATIAALAGRVS